MMHGDFSYQEVVVLNTKNDVGLIRQENPVRPVESPGEHGSYGGGRGNDGMSDERHHDLDTELQERIRDLPLPQTLLIRRQMCRGR